MQKTNDSIIINNSATVSITVATIIGATGIGLCVYGLLLSDLRILSLAGLGLLIVAVLVLVFAKSSTIELTKSRDSFIRAKGLFTESSTQKFMLSEVALVELNIRQIARTQGEPSNRQNQQVATIFLRTKSGQQIKLGSGSRTVGIGGLMGSMIQDAPLKKEADEIAAFIGVQMQSSGDLGPRQMMNEISTMYKGTNDESSNGSQVNVDTGAVSSLPQTNVSNGQAITEEEQSRQTETKL